MIWSSTRATRTGARCRVGWRCRPAKARTIPVFYSMMTSGSPRAQSARWPGPLCAPARHGLSGRTPGSHSADHRVAGKWVNAVVPILTLKGSLNEIAMFLSPAGIRRAHTRFCVGGKRSRAGRPRLLGSKRAVGGAFTFHGTVQSTTSSPSTRENSRTLLVTTVPLAARTVAAIHKSASLMAIPCASR